MPRTDTSTPPGLYSPRYRRLLIIGALTVMLLGLLAGLSILSLALGWRPAAAAFALGLLLSSPLVLLGPVQDWWRHRRGRRRRHWVRPKNFGRGKG